MNMTGFIDDACQLVQEARVAEQLLEFETAYKRYEKCMLYFQQVYLLLREEGGKSVIEVQMKNIMKNMDKLRPFLADGVATETPLIKGDSMRDKVAKEISSSEQSYVGFLKSLTNVFIKPLRFQSRTGVPILTLTDVVDLFDTIKPVLEIHLLLLASLKKRINDEWKSNDCVGDIFVKFCQPLQKAYEGYVVGFTHASTRVAELQKSNGRFQMFLESVRQDNLPSLQSIMIMPVQRIPRYKLFLEKLVETTAKTHKDYVLLEKALKDIECAATHINASIEAKGSTARVESLFEQPLQLDKDQRLIKEGVLQKTNRHGQTVPTHFFLFTGLIVYATKNKETQKFSTRRRREVIGAAPTPEVQSCAFQLQCRHKSFTVVATTRKECQEWIRAVLQAVKECKS